MRFKDDLKDASVYDDLILQGKPTYSTQTVQHKKKRPTVLTVNVLLASTFAKLTATARALTLLNTTNNRL